MRCVIGSPTVIGAPLEAAALAVGRLDAALSGHPLLPAWTFWSQFDTARRHAETDGRRVDLYRLAALLHGLPLGVGATLSLAERGGDITALAVELRSWIIQPDPGQRDLLDSGFAHLRQAGPRSAPPCPFTSGSAVSRASR
jgi:hypothetical protein